MSLTTTTQRISLLRRRSIATLLLFSLLLASYSAVPSSRTDEPQIPAVSSKSSRHSDTETHKSKRKQENSASSECDDKEKKSSKEKERQRTRQSSDDRDECDKEAPTPIIHITAPPDKTVEATGPTTPIDIGVAQATADGAPLSTRADNYGPFRLGTTIVTWKAVDASGATATAQQKITIKDTIPPLISIIGSQAVTLALNENYVEQGATASDLVDGDLTQAITAASAVNTATPGTYKVTYRVSDSSLNTSEISRTVTIVVPPDRQPPVVTAPPAIMVEATALLTPVPLGVATALDAIDGPLVPTADNTGPFALGIHQIRWSATDAAGNSGYAIQTVTVVDTTPPILTPPGDISTQAIAATPLAIGLATATDIFGATVTNDAPPTFPGGETLVTWTAVDPNGNRSSAIQKITVQHIAPPTLTAPPDQSVEATAPTTPVDIGLAQASAADGTPLSVQADNYGPFRLGTTVVTWKASDSYGRVVTAQQTITVKDTTPPLIKIVGGAALTLLQNETYVEQGATATDLVDGDLTAVIVTSGNINTTTPGHYTLTYRATDSSLNTSEAARTITVVVPPDIQPPVVTAPPSLTIEATALLTPVQLGTATAVDSRDGPLLPAADNTGPFSLGVHQVTWSATDAAGNTGYAVQNVTVVDTTPPLITPPGAISITAGGTTSLAIGLATATDIFGATVTNDAPPLFPIGDTLITWTAADPNGNRATATQKITVQLLAPPTITAPADLVVEATGPLTAVDLGVAQASAGDGTPLVVQVDNSGPFPLGDTIVTWSATDASGGVISAQQIVTVEDTTPPDITVLGANPVSTYCEFWFYPDAGATASDLVDGDLTTNIIRATNVGVQMLEVVYAVQDSSGNEAVATRTLQTPCNFDLMLNTPYFTTASGAYLPSTRVIEATGPLTPLAPIETPIAYDLNGNTLPVVTTMDPQVWGTVVFDLTPIPNEVPVGNYTVVWTAVGPDGVIGQLAQTQQVVDTTAPSLTLNGPAEITINLHDSYVDTGATAADIVDGDLTSQITVAGDVNIALPGSYTLTYRVSDSNFNTSELVRRINVVSSDTQPPVVSAPSAITIEAIGALTPVTLGVAIAVDAQDGALPATPDNVGPFPMGHSQVIWSATDVSGNTGTATQSVDVVDTTPPAITAPGNIDTYVAGPTPLFIGAATASDLFGVKITNNAPTIFPIGATLVTWTATDPSGNSATATQTILLRQNVAPVAKAGSNIVANVNTPVSLDGSQSFDPDGVITQYEWSEGFTLLSNAVSFTKSDFGVGLHQITLKVIDNHDGWDSTTVTVDVRAPITPKLTFDPPLDGATVTGDLLQVSGTFEAPVNSGITINGQVAALEGTHFSARVPVVAGQNTIKATLTTQAGVTATQTANVTSDGVPPAFQITADALEGVGALRVTFNAVNNTQSDVTLSAPALWIGSTPFAPQAQLTYAVDFAPGVWPVTFTTIDATGQVINQEFIVVVHDRDKMDQDLKTLWSNMVQAFNAGDRAGAMTFLSDLAQQKYGPAFDLLGANLPPIFASFSPLHTSEITPSFAEYAVTRPINGQNKLFLLYFLRDPQGVWRLHAM